MVTASWVLSLMMHAQSMHPYRATYERTSEAIAKHASERPLFSGQHGDAKTAALIVAVAQYESSFQPDAEGDCTKGGKKAKCTTPGAIPHSFCLLQVNESNFKTFGITREDIQTDIDVCVRTALSIMHQSFTICRALTLEDRLRFYAGGGNGCPTNEDAAIKSRQRMLRGMWLFKAVPPTW